MCPATGLVQIIGRKYALRLLTVIGEYKSIRFNDLKSVMDDLSSSTLTIRLAELERAELIERQTYSETPPRVEYNLTTEGRKLRQSLFDLSKMTDLLRTADDAAIQASVEGLKSRLGVRIPEFR